MKIAYIIPSLVANGPCLVAYDLVMQMVAHGHSCELFYLDERGELKFPCPMHHITLGTQIDLSGFDIVHSHELRPNLYVLLHKQKKPKYICTLHNYVFRDYRSTYGGLKGWLGAWAFLLSVRRHDKDVALSKDMQQYYTRYLPKRKLTFAYNTRVIHGDEDDVTSWDNYKKITAFRGEGHVLIGTICRVLMRKNLCLVFKALALMPQTYRFVVVGDGPDMERVKNQANKAGVADRVLFIGRQENAYRLLPLMDVFVIPSASEGFPLSLLEAAYYSKKCVCSNLDIFRECFNAGEVKMFHLPDVKELAMKIEEAVKDDKLGERLRQKYDNVYAPECFYNRYLDIYSDALSEK